MTDDDEKEDRKKTNTQYMQIQYQKILQNFHTSVSDL